MSPSNLGGLISPFVGDMLRGEANYEIIAVEPASCPSLTRGVYAYDYCDTGKICPLAKMYTLGSGFIPSANHAGGLRYHGMSSIVSQLYEDGILIMSALIPYLSSADFVSNPIIVWCKRTWESTDPST